jgi:hypothetical protein
MMGVHYEVPMLNVEIWAQDKNPAIAFLSISLALAAREKNGILTHLSAQTMMGLPTE